MESTPEYITAPLSEADSSSLLIRSADQMPLLIVVSITQQGYFLKNLQTWPAVGTRANTTQRAELRKCDWRLRNSTHPMVGQLEVQKAMMQSPHHVKGDFLIPGLTAVLLVVIRSFLHDVLAMPCWGKCCSTEQSLCTAPLSWSEGCWQNREDTSSFVEPKHRAAPLTFAPGLGGRGDIARKKGYCPFLQILSPWQRSGLPAWPPQHLLKPSPLLSRRTAEGGSLACFLLWDQITYWDRIFLPVFPVLCKMGGVLGPAQGQQVLSECPFKPLGHHLQISWKQRQWVCGVQLEMHLLCFMVSWASSWLFHCPRQQFSALSTCSWLLLTNGNIFDHCWHLPSRLWVLCYEKLLLYPPSWCHTKYTPSLFSGSLLS